MSILWTKKIRNKAVEKFILSHEQPYWTRYKYRNKWYIMTFEYNIYEITV